MLISMGQMKRGLLFSAMSVFAWSCGPAPIVVCSPQCQTSEVCDVTTAKCVAVSNGGSSSGKGGSKPGDAKGGQTSSTGGTVAQGGAPSNGGVIAAQGGTTSQGGTTTSNGGTVSAQGGSVNGGHVSAGGTTSSQGGNVSQGGTASKGGAVAAGGAISMGGIIASGGSVGAGGASSTGGFTASGGVISSGGVVASGGSTGSTYCNACSTNPDPNCGDPMNFCVNLGGGHCGIDCSANQPCPADAECVTLTNAMGQAVGKNCLPKTRKCGPSAGGAISTGGTLAMGGTTASGGAASTGGISAGGATAQGGTISAGGAVATGGAAGMGGAVACTTDTWANYGQNFFATTCNIGCHTHPVNMATQAGVLAGKAKITKEISSGDMPPQGISAAQKARILKYLSCGVP